MVKYSYYVPEETFLEYRQEQEIFLFPTAPRPALEPTLSPVHQLTRAVSAEVKRSLLEVQQSSSSTAEITND